MNIAADGINLAKESLVEWRKRYDGRVYPEKVVFNLFYRAYPYEWFWENRRMFFGSDMRGLAQPIASPQSAHENILGTVRKIQLENVHPFMPQWMAQKKNIGILAHELLDPLVADAAQGSNRAIEEIEYTFCYNNVVFRCMNMFFAAGGAGLDPVEACGEATGVIVSGEYLTSNLRDLMTVFQKVMGNAINSEYRPLPNLF